MKRYRIVDSTTEEVVAEDLQTRQAARMLKRQLEYKHRACNSFHAMPPRYYVETDIGHPAGPGIYYH